MGDKVITSQQGFADSWNIGLVNTDDTVPRTLNLCDFTIPSGYVIDMSKSYVAFNTSIADAAGAQVVNAGLQLQTVDKDTIFNVPNSALIRNCAISCSNAGQLESIRRNDTLSCGVWGLSHTAEEMKGDMNTLSVFNGGAGASIGTSFNLDRVCDNITPDGGTTMTGLNGLPITSSNISRDVKIPIKDMFGVGVVEDWDTSKWGETRIHLETNFQLLRAQEWGGAEDTTLGFDGTTFQGAVVAPAAVAAGADAPVLIEIEHNSGEWEYTCPFFVGQTLEVNGNVTGTGAFATATVVIETIQYQLDSLANPITGSTAVYVGLSASYYNNATGAPTTLTDVVIRANIAENLKITVNRAELVLFTKPQGNTSSAYEYVTYTTEEDNGNAILHFNRGYMLEPEAENVLIACCDNGQILPKTDLISYRYAINNDEQTGNRDVLTSNITAFASPIQYDRLSRCLNRSAQIPFRNTGLTFYQQEVTQANALNMPISMICETVEVTKESKMLNLEIHSTALNQIILYKQIAKRISI